ncbi:MAG: GIY-YIG nuclease family protein [bacterium]
MSKKTGIIYAIENKVNGKIYIELTINYQKRISNHILKLLIAITGQQSI